MKTEEQIFRYMEIADMVENPPHYQLFQGIEVKDVRERILDKAPANLNYNDVDDWSRAWEYLTRMWNKNGLEDAKKARWYLNRLIERLETHKSQG